MKILVLADQKSKYLYDFYEPDKLKDIDLIISCGDLSPSYLSFFVTLCNVPLLYVRGNHDDKYEKTPPDGCICIEDDIYVHDGIRILGLGGSMEYIPRASNQYSEKSMCRRVRKLRYKLWRHRGFDILVTHAPAYQVNDLEDLPHRGSRSSGRCLRSMSRPSSSTAMCTPITAGSSSGRTVTGRRPLSTASSTVS